MPTKHKPTLFLGLLLSPSEDGLSRTWTCRRSCPWMSDSVPCRGKPGGQGGWATRNCDVSPPPRTLRSWWCEMSSRWDSYSSPVCTGGQNPASCIMFIKSLPHQTNETLVPAMLRVPPLSISKVLFGKESILISRDQWAGSHATVIQRIWLISTVNVSKSR